MKKEVQIKFVSLGALERRRVPMNTVTSEVHFSLLFVYSKVKSR